MLSSQWGLAGACTTSSYLPQACQAMADVQAPSQPAEAQGGGAGAALEALQAAAASVQASVRAAEAICAALQPMVGALELAPPTRRVGHERRRGAGAELATVQRQGELLQQSVESLEGLMAQDGEADAAAEQVSVCWASERRVAA